MGGVASPAVACPCAAAAAVAAAAETAVSEGKGAEGVEKWRLALFDLAWMCVFVWMGERLELTIYGCRCVYAHTYLISSVSVV